MVGVLMLISIFVVAVGVLAVMFFSTSPQGSTPAVNIIATNESRLIKLYHNGGDPLSSDNLQIFVDGTPRSFNGIGPDKTWTVGETLDYTDTVSPSGQMPQKIDVVYNGTPGNAVGSFLVATLLLGPQTSVPADLPFPPVADFDGIPRSVYVGHAVTFTDASTNSPTIWLWDFGDLSTLSSDQNPSHAYATPGTYSVTLTATNAGGSGSVTRTNYIKVNALPDPPVANFTWVPIWGLTPANAIFTDTSTNGPTSWSWDFGDGDSTNATDQNPVHTYTKMGYYNLSLTATNEGGSNTTDATQFITVGKYVQGWRARYYNVEYNTTASYWDPVNLVFTNNPPRLNFQNDYCIAHYPVTITSGSDVSNWPQPYLGTYEYYSAEYDAFLKIDTPGTYTFSLESDDGSWLWIDGAMIIDNGVIHQPTVKTGSVYLTAGYHPIKVRMYNHAGGADLALQYSATGISQQFVTQAYRITAVDPPVADFSGSPVSGPMPLKVQFTDKSTFPSSWVPTPNNWSWSFGDLDLTNQTQQNPVHTYAGYGSYTVSLTATNDGGSSTATKTKYISVDPIITVTAGAGGSISPGTVVTPYGTNQTFTITNITGYYIAGVSVDGSSVRSPTNITTSYTFTNVTTAHTISATFIANPLIQSAVTSGSGTISPSGSTSVTYGGSQTYTIANSTGYYISSVVVDGASKGSISSYTFTNVTATHTISVTFTGFTYPITATAGTGGSVSPSGTTYVSYNGNQTYTIAGSTGYHVADVLVDGVSQGVITTYPFTNVLTSHTISATFTQNTRGTIFSDGFETVRPSGNGWTETGTVNWGAYTPRHGNYDVQFMGGGTAESIRRTISTAGNSNIIVSFAWSAQSLETGEYIRAEYSTNGGTSYTTLSQLNGPITVVPTTLTTYTSSALPTAAEHDSNFVLRFIISASSSTNDYGYVDDVQVTGIPD
jgi:PKD repeat protein